MLLPAAVVPIMELLRRKARRVLDWQLVDPSRSESKCVRERAMAKAMQQLTIQ